MNVCGSGIMHMEGVLLAAYVGCQSCFNRSDRCIYWPEQGNCLPIFGTFSILLHAYCASFLSFSTIYVLLQFLTLLTSMRIAIFRHFVFLVLLPVYTFFSFTPLFWFLCAMCTTFSSMFSSPDPRVRWAIAITWRPSSSSVVRRTS